MNRVRISLLFILALLFGASLIFGGMRAYARSILPAGPDQGNVDVLLEPGSDFSLVLPGQTVPYRPVLVNKGRACYVSVCWRFSEYEKYITVSGLSPLWRFREEDGRWYWPEPLPPGGSLPLFDGLTFGRDLPSEAQGRSIEVNIDAYAVGIRDPGSALHSSGKTESAYRTAPVKTGDPQNRAAFLLLAGSAWIVLTAGSYTAGVRRKEKK